MLTNKRGKPHSCPADCGHAKMWALHSWSLQLLRKKNRTHVCFQDLWLLRGIGGGSGMDWELGLVSANYYIQNGKAMRSCCTAQETVPSLLG